jgi:hypothetical protein
MAIYVDTNVMYQWWTLGEPARLALSALAFTLGLEIVIPSLVFEELEARWRRELQSAVDSFETASSKMTVLFDLEYVESEPAPNVEYALGTWRNRFTEAFALCEVSADDALSGLRREISGSPPAAKTSGKPGRGGRDSALWLAAVRDHLTRDEDGHFLTKDGGFWLGDHPHPVLKSDFHDARNPIQIHRGLEAFIAPLGEAIQAEPIVAEVSTRGLPLLIAGLEFSRTLPSAVWELDGAAMDELDFVTRVTGGTLERIERASRYQGPGGQVLLVDATWQIEFSLRYRPREGAPDGWFRVEDLHARGRAQIYLADPKSGSSSGELIAAQLKPKELLYRQGDQLMTMTAVEDPSGAADWSRTPRHGI